MSWSARRRKDSEIRSGDVSARLGEAIHEASSHWVAERDHDDWDRASCLFRCLSGWRGAYGNDVRLKTQAFGSKGGKPFATALRRKVVDVDGLPVNISQIAQGLEERFKSRRSQCTGIKRKEAEPRDILRLLGVPSERPYGCRAAEQRDELASSHALPSRREKIAPYHAVNRAAPCALQQIWLANARLGSKAAVGACPRYVRLPPNSDRIADIAAGRFRANSRPPVRQPRGRGGRHPGSSSLRNETPECRAGERGKCAWSRAGRQAWIFVPCGLISAASASRASAVG
jgi:hypothetical protein